MRLVIIESPYAGDIKRNKIYAQRCLLNSLNLGEAPLASHLLYPQVLNEDDPREREWGIAAGYAWMEKAEAVIIYTDYGLSPGMEKAISVAAALNKSIEFRKIGVNNANQE